MKVMFFSFCVLAKKSHESHFIHPLDIRRLKLYTTTPAAFVSKRS
jgi:hypothetical protein